MWFPTPIAITLVISVIAYLVTYRIIPHFKEMFIKANLFGIDLSKGQKQKIPEAMGVITGCVFLIAMFLSIPMLFSQHILANEDFPHSEFVEMIAALLSICCMLLLGFADDVLDLRWRHKLLLPSMASLPLLMVYYINFNSTTVIIPKLFRASIGFSVNLGIFYYVYMGMLAVFCTNAINILAGVNGLEVGQSIVIAVSIALFNFIELYGVIWKSHQFSLYFILPYIGTSFGLLHHNWYPSQVFVGDTFCYFSGMTFAVVGILGHFSKTMLLFFIPQVANFIYSVPQLFRFVPCPRHRMPRYNYETDKLEASTFKFKVSDLSRLGQFTIFILRTLKLIYWQEVGKDSEFVECNNLTLINFVLLYNGPTHEAAVTTILIIIQLLCSVLAFSIRYPLASLFYDTTNFPPEQYESV